MKQQQQLTLRGCCCRLWLERYAKAAMVCVKASTRNNDNALRENMKPPSDTKAHCVTNRRGLYRTDRSPAIQPVEVCESAQH